MPNETIRAQELQNQLSGDHPIQVIDIRDGDNYAAAHIPGALNIPVQKMQYHAGSLQEVHMVVLYTSRGLIGDRPQAEPNFIDPPPDENLARETARLLREKGGYDVRVLEGGLDAWAEAGLPIEREGHAGSTHE